MRRLLVGMVVILASSPLGVMRAAADHPDVGTVTTLRSFDANANELPEGVAVDKRGRIYVSMPFIGELRVIDVDGSERLVAHLPAGNGFGPLGLAVDAPGNVYVGVVTFDAATQGVYRVSRSGAAERLPGTEGITFANGVALDDRGNLYVTDSIPGLVWRVPKNGSAEVWSDSSLLRGNDTAPLPFPVGANGIGYSHRTVYVTNTEMGSVVAIPVETDGDAGASRVVAQDAALGGADGLALDVHDNVYVAVIAQSKIVRVGRDGSIETLADAADGLDYASSIAFGTGRGDRTTLFAVNFSIGPVFGDVRTWGPALLAVESGEPGSPVP